MWVAFLVHWEVDKQGHLTYILAMVEEVSARGIFHRAVWCLLTGFGCALFSACESTSKSVTTAQSPLHFQAPQVVGAQYALPVGQGKCLLLVGTYPR